MLQARSAPVSSDVKVLYKWVIIIIIIFLFIIINRGELLRSVNQCIDLDVVWIKVKVNDAYLAYQIHR